jgi:ribosomal protein S18 acetylase RimI-like enzyme
MALPVLYRSFRNPDPPGLVRTWNESCVGRGSVFLQGVTPLETYVLGKLTFDPAGLVVAEEDGEVLGFAHAGFGPDAMGQQVARESGVVSVIAVRPAVRRRGIGTELLRRTEAYLRAAGARSIVFGAMRPANPFYWGVYGGSDQPGVLASDADLGLFLQARGYAPVRGMQVFQRNLDTPVRANDPRLPALKRRYELKAQPRPASPRWYEELTLAPLEMLEFQLHDSTSGAMVGRARTWDMDLYGWRWHQPAAGLVDFEVRDDLRRLGLAKLLMSHVIKHLQDQFYTLTEIQIPDENAAGLKLVRGFGFKQVDSGRLYRRVD